MPATPPDDRPASFSDHVHAVEQALVQDLLGGDARVQRFLHHGLDIAGLAGLQLRGNLI